MVNLEEKKYLEIVKDCIDRGTLQSDRTKVGTLAIFGQSMRFSLANSVFPLLTTKSVAFRVVLEELLFFIRADTDNKVLTDKNVHIWDGNSTKEFFELNNINREAGDLGPIYGFQWRHFGAPYTTSSADYSNQGIDQLNNVIETIKKDPNSRRMIVVSWNPTQLKEMALPPCHCLFQFLVGDGKLSCILYQRSGDMGLGIPFNIASYSLLTCMVAKITGLEPCEFIHFIGDAHVYTNHIEPLKQQLEREPRPFPTLKFADKEYKKIEDFEVDDFIIEDYKPFPKIVMKMAI